MDKGIGAKEKLITGPLDGACGKWASVFAERESSLPERRQALPGTREIADAREIVVKALLHRARRNG